MDIHFQQQANRSAECDWKQEEPVASGQCSVVSPALFLLFLLTADHWPLTTFSTLQLD
jgi:hypothetical protein